jgi:LPS O-antigen subunit length determinant protein (WzzB/FepE family)
MEKSTHITLKEYVDVRINNVEQATELARAGMEKRLEGMNEFRDTLKDQASKFVTRDELNAQLDKIEALIKSLELSKAILEGKATQASFYISLFFGVVGAISGIVSLVSRFL